MNLFLLASMFFFLSFDASTTTSSPDVNTIDAEIIMKSKLNKDQDRLLVKLELPVAETVWFELYDREGDIKHLWEERVLEDGAHDIALPLPDLTPATYVVKLMSDQHEITQLVFLQ